MKVPVRIEHADMHAKGGLLITVGDQFIQLSKGEYTVVWLETTARVGCGITAVSGCALPPNIEDYDTFGDVKPAIRDHSGEPQPGVVQRVREFLRECLAKKEEN